MGKVRTRRSTEAWLRQAALLRRVHELIGNFDAEMDVSAGEAVALLREVDEVFGGLSAQKGVTTRLKNRVQKGVCPCCNRYFAQLQRHMTTQHPNFAATAEETETVAH